MMIRAPFRRGALTLAVAAAAGLCVLALSGALSGTANASGSHASKPKVVVKKVAVVDDMFQPGKMTIKVGQEVDFVWSKHNYDSHNVTLSSGPKGVKRSRFTSTTGTEGIHFLRKFTIAGKYHFYCTIHPETMNFALTVKK